MSERQWRLLIGVLLIAVVGVGMLASSFGCDTIPVFLCVMLVDMLYESSWRRSFAARDREYVARLESLAATVQAERDATDAWVASMKAKCDAADALAESLGELH